MPASGTKKNAERSSSEESRKGGKKDKKDKDKKDKKKAKKDEDVGSNGLPHPIDVGLGPVHLDVPVPASPPLSATAAGSAPASVPADVSNGEIFMLMQQMLKSQEKVQSQVGKIDEISVKLGELSVNQTNTSTQLAGVEGRLDSIDSRIIKLEEANTASSSNNVWGDMPSAPAAQPAHPPHVWGSREKGSSSFAQGSGGAFIPTPPNQVVPAFEKPGRPNVLQCNTQDGVLITRDVVHKFFSDALADKGLACELEVGGRFDTGKRFAVFLNAPGCVGEECVKSLLRSKKVDGKWREFFVVSPSNAQVQIHFDEDKGPRQIKLEITTHKFTKVLKAKYGEDKFYCRKDAGKIFKEGAPIACVTVSESSADMQWFKRTIGSSGIDKEAMYSSFKELFCEEWCS